MPKPWLVVWLVQLYFHRMIVSLTTCWRASCEAASCACEGAARNCNCITGARGGCGAGKSPGFTHASNLHTNAKMRRPECKFCSRPITRMSVWLASKSCCCRDHLLISLRIQPTSYHGATHTPQIIKLDWELRTASQEGMLERTGHTTLAGQHLRMYLRQLSGPPARKQV